MKDASYIEIFERLKTAAGVTKDNELALRLGVSKQNVADAKKRKTVPTSWIPRAAQKFNVTTDWLFFGSEKPGGKFLAGEEEVEIPLVEAVLSAGGGSLETSAEAQERGYVFRRDFLRRKGNIKDMILMRVQGDSMSPEIMEHDVVLLDQSRQAPMPGHIYAVGFEDMIYLKRIDCLPGKVILKSVNPAYPPVELLVRGQMADLFRVIGQVLWVGREYR